MNCSIYLEDVSLSPVQSLRQPYGNPTGTLYGTAAVCMFLCRDVFYTMVTCSICMMHVCFQCPVQLKVNQFWETVCWYAADTVIG